MLIYMSIRMVLQSKPFRHLRVEFGKQKCENPGPKVIRRKTSKTKTLNHSIIII